MMNKQIIAKFYFFVYNLQNTASVLNRTNRSKARLFIADAKRAKKCQYVNALNNTLIILAVLCDLCVFARDEF